MAARPVSLTQRPRAQRPPAQRPRYPRVTSTPRPPQKSRSNPDLAMIAKDFISAKDLRTYSIFSLAMKKSFAISKPNAHSSVTRGTSE